MPIFFEGRRTTNAQDGDWIVETCLCERTMIEGLREDALDAHLFIPHRTFPWQNFDALPAEFALIRTLAAERGSSPGFMQSGDQILLPSLSEGKAKFKVSGFVLYSLPYCTPQ